MGGVNNHILVSVVYVNVSLISKLWSSQPTRKLLKYDCGKRYLDNGGMREEAEDTKLTPLVNMILIRHLVLVSDFLELRCKGR